MVEHLVDPLSIIHLGALLDLHGWTRLHSYAWTLLHSYAWTLMDSHSGSVKLQLSILKAWTLMVGHCRIHTVEQCWISILGRWRTFMACFTEAVQSVPLRCEKRPAIRSYAFLFAFAHVLGSFILVQVAFMLAQVSSFLSLRPPPLSLLLPRAHVGQFTAKQGGYSISHSGGAQHSSGGQSCVPDVHECHYRR